MSSCFLPFFPDQRCPIDKVLPEVVLFERINRREGADRREEDHRTLARSDGRNPEVPVTGRSRRIQTYPDGPGLYGPPPGSQ